MHRWYLLKCRWRIRYLWEACVLDWKQAKTKSFGKNRLLVEGGQEGAEANGGWLILPYFPSGAQISCYSSRYKWKTCLPTPTPTPGEREVIYLKGRMRRVGMQGDNVLQSRVEIHRVFNYPSLCQMVKWAWSGNWVRELSRVGGGGEGRLNESLELWPSNQTWAEAEPRDVIGHNMYLNIFEEQNLVR